jgi:hypothetical protein
MTTMTDNIRFKLRGGAAAAITALNEVPLARELIVETDTGKIKMGDGVTAWTSLPYWNAGGISSFNTRTGAVTLSYADVTGALGFTPTTAAGAVAAVLAGGGTFASKVITAASDATGGAGFNLPHGVAPTSPVNGDLWTTLSTINVYINGAAIRLAGANQTTSISGAWTFTNTTLVLGNATTTASYSLGTGAMASGNTKTVNIGTGGVAGSVTNTTIGTVGGGTSRLLFHGTRGFTQIAPASKAAAATLTALEIQSGLIQYTGAADNLTTPTGTQLDTQFAHLVTDTAVDFAVINTGSGAATMVMGTGVTPTGSMVIAAGTSGQFRLRKTGTATYTLYRLS